jgi:hypothetical protein
VLANADGSTPSSRKSQKLLLIDAEVVVAAAVSDSDIVSTFVKLAASDIELLPAELLLSELPPPLPPHEFIARTRRVINSERADFILSSIDINTKY